MAAVPDIERGDAEVIANTTHGLYQRYGRQIYAYCFHQLRSREEAEDAVQTTFLNAFRGLQGGTVTHAEQAWLFKIAQHVCYARRSSSVRRLRLETPNNFETLQETIPSPARNGDVELIGLEDALEGMPENQRRAILLREWQGLSYREIAEELELSPASVEMLIFRARRTLASALDEDVAPKKQRTAGRRLSAASLLAAIKSLLGGSAAVKSVAVAVTATATAVAGVSGVSENKLLRPSPSKQSPVRVVAAAAPVSTPLEHASVAAPVAAEPATASQGARPLVESHTAAAGLIGSVLPNTPAPEAGQTAAVPVAAPAVEAAAAPAPVAVSETPAPTPAPPPPTESASPRAGTAPAPEAPAKKNDSGGGGDKNRHDTNGKGDNHGNNSGNGKEPAKDSRQTAIVPVPQPVPPTVTVMSVSAVPAAPAVLVVAPTAGSSDAKDKHQGNKEKRHGHDATPPITIQPVTTQPVTPQPVSPPLLPTPLPQPVTPAVTVTTAPPAEPRKDHGNGHGDRHGSAPVAPTPVAPTPVVPSLVAPTPVAPAPPAAAQPTVTTSGDTRSRGHGDGDGKRNGRNK